MGTEQISKQAKKKQKQKHVAIEGPGAINKLFKRNFAAAVRVHDPATAMARGDEMVGIVSTLEDPNSQGKKTGNDVPRSVMPLGCQPSNVPEICITVQSCIELTSLQNPTVH